MRRTSGGGRNRVKQRVAAVILMAFTIAAVLPPLTAWALLQGTTTRVSITDGEAQATTWSAGSSITPDGRYVAFYSGAANLVSGDTNGSDDVFVRDRIGGTTTRVSITDGEAQALGGGSSWPSISADGRYVAFYSDATNLVSGDTNSATDIFVRDRIAGTTTRASVATGGAQGFGSCSDPSISADGRYVAFYSDSTNLVSGDTNGVTDVFVRDLIGGTTTRVSVATGGAQANGYSDEQSISASGRYVAFRSTATTLVSGDTNGNQDIFVRDVVAGTTTRVSVATGGAQATGGNSGWPSFSADESCIVFDSGATNLVPGDTNDTGDIFVRDLVAGTTTRASVGAGGVQSNGSSQFSSISSDGRYVALASAATNLVAGDTNSLRDVFVRDTATGITIRVSVTTAGAQVSGGHSGWPVITPDGRYVAFGSEATNLVSGDTNGATDVFVRMAATAPLAPVYRFYNFTNNTHFFTPSLDEANSVILNYPKVFRYEGTAYYTNPANNTQPLYRFYNRRSGSHFYTASTTEADHVIATWPDIFTYEGETYKVSPSPVFGSTTVYRFYNLTNGSHFYTASEDERDTVIATWPHIYSYEGPAFWLGQ
ncbi:MAG: hypothetical protein Q7W51_01930 [Coriobacteriia bacterium]|nr:hypothetical protein [Coriobacteriia bacterium]